MTNALLCTSEGVSRVQQALREQDLDGWLLYEFHHINPIPVALLGLGKTTRRAFVLIPAEGEPVAMIHAIEASSWRQWPFARRTYSSWREMEEQLAALVEERDRLAMEISPGGAVPTLDYVPAGIVGVLLELGKEIASSGDLVTQFHSVLTETQLRDHREAAEIVRDVARRAFERAADAIREGAPTTEGALSEWIVAELNGAGLVDQVSCIVAVGPKASDSHYAPVGEGETIRRGDLLLIDLWGARAGSVPADQTWMAVMGASVDARTREIWEAVRDARDAAVESGATATSSSTARGIPSTRTFTGAGRTSTTSRVGTIGACSRVWRFQWSRASTCSTRSVCAARSTSTGGRTARS